jgi:hypothetical protein
MMKYYARKTMRCTTKHRGVELAAIEQTISKALPSYSLLAN